VKLGALLMPSHPPERPIREGQQRDLDEIERLDRLGFEEAWIGEHFTAIWEPCPAPDLLIAQAVKRTERIHLGPLGHLLPYHHPVELAHRVAYLDHLAEGRYQLGVGVSALPTDHQLFGLDGTGALHRQMTFEALEMMTQLWTGASDFKGAFWSMGKPGTGFEGLGYHLRPYQNPHPPIAIAAMTPGSPNLRLAGEKGYIPVSFSISPDSKITAQHWTAIEESAARSGLVADRRKWRVIRDVYVARTDTEARELALGGMMGRCWREFLLPLYVELGLSPLLKGAPEMPDDALTVEYLADHLWLVGSPDTVIDKIMTLQEAAGGFGYLVTVSYDSNDELPQWERSLRLLADRVQPACALAGMEPLSTLQALP
jgi:alkanesulfonate monooxygenase SsuD/methylene tetrahydromethanopterin reductase-like flavin-dependent oxidoreductase (luciferase family)